MPDPTRPRKPTEKVHRGSAAPADQTATQAEKPGMPESLGGDTMPEFAPAQRASELGTFGRYRILKELGRGGMGAVFLGLDSVLERKVALKVMLPKYLANAESRERFLREARTAAMIKNDHVVTIIDVDIEQGIPFIAMEYLHGCPLDKYLKTKGELSLSLALRVCRETALGLSAAHDLGLVHRDIKPANLWLESPNGRVKLLDFGLARIENDDIQLTGTGVVMGTPLFMSPEQGRGLKVDHRSDLFSLGVLLYRLTTGRLPFRGNSAMAILTSLAIDSPAPVRQINPELPEKLESLVERLLVKDADGRIQRAIEVVIALREIERPGDSAGSKPALAPIPTAPMPIAVPADDVWEGIGTEPQPETGESETGAVSATSPTRVGSGGKRPPRKASFAFAVLGGATVVLGSVLFASLVLKTQRGTLIVDTDDPDIEVVVKKDGTVVRDRTRDREIDLTVGEYSIELVENKAGLNLDPESFEITAGGRTRVRAWREKPRVPAALPRVSRAVPVENTFLPNPGGPSAGPGPFDALDPNAIPKEERFDWQPKELVAVVGSHRGMGDRFHELSPDGHWIFWRSNYSGGYLLDAATLTVRFRDPSLYNGGYAFSPDGKWLAMAGDRRPGDLPPGGWGVRIVDLTGPEPKSVRYIAPRNENGSSTVGFLPDSKTLVTGTNHGGLYLWDLSGPGTKPALVLREANPANPIRTVQLTASADGSKLVVLENGNGAWTIRGYDLRKGESKPALTLPGTVRRLSQFALSPDGRSLLVSATADWKNWNVTLWDLSGLDPKAVHTMPWAGPVTTVSFTADGKSVWLTDDQVTAEWSIVGKPWKLHELPKDRQRVVRIDSRRFRILDGNGKPVVESPPAVASNSHVPAVVGDSLLTFADNNLWSIRDGRFTPGRQDDALFSEKKSWVGNALQMMATRPSPDRKLVAGIGSGGIRVFAIEGTTLRSRAMLRSPPNRNHLDAIRSFAWCPWQQDSVAILTLQNDGSVRRWPLTQEPPKSEPVVESSDEDYTRGELACSPDGRWIALRGAESVVAWDLPGPKPTDFRLLGPPDSKPTSVAFTPDSRGLLVAFDTRQIVWFDMLRPYEPGRIFLPRGGKWILPSPGGGRLAVLDPGEWAGRHWVALKVWDFTARAWVAWIRLPDYPAGEGFEIQWADAGRHLIVPQFGLVYVLRVPDADSEMADPDRRGAKWVLSIGGTIRINGEDKELQTENEMPRERFAFTGVTLRGNKNVNDTKLESLKDCRNLTRLDLHGTQVTDAGLMNFMDCEDLIELGLEQTAVTDAGLALFRQCKGLTSLHLRETKVTAEAVAEFARTLPQCKIDWDRGVIEPRR